MKAKVEISIGHRELEKLHLVILMQKLQVLRFCFTTKYMGKLFSNEKEVPYEHQMVFARLYKLLGYDNKSIRKYESRKALYLKEVKKLWEAYYRNTSHNIMPLDTQLTISKRSRAITFFAGFLETLNNRFNDFNGRMVYKKVSNPAIRKIIELAQDGDYINYLNNCLEFWEKDQSVFKGSKLTNTLMITNAYHLKAPF